MGRRRGGTAAHSKSSNFRDKERNYGLGERNPRTLGTEPEWKTGDRKWRAVRRWAASHSSVGAKYI